MKRTLPVFVLVLLTLLAGGASADAAKPFQPSFDILSISDSSTGGHGNVAQHVGVPQADHVIGAIKYTLPAGWDIAKVQSGGDDEPIVGTGTLQVDVGPPALPSCDGIMESYPLTVVDQGNYVGDPPGVETNWVVQGYPFEQFLFVVKGNVASGQTLEDAAMFNSGPDVCSLTTLDLTFQGISSENPVTPETGEGGRIVLTNPSTLGVYTWSLQFKSKPLAEPGAHTVNRCDQVGIATTVPDTDADGIGNGCDNCPNAVNANQLNWDEDSTGDVCDSDVDGDGVANGADQCAFTLLGQTVDVNGCSQVQVDQDLDGKCDPGKSSPTLCTGSDNCPTAYNPTQANVVHPLTPDGDACEDPDADQWMDSLDNCPDNYDPFQTDADLDGRGDLCDTPCPADPDCDDDNVSDGPADPDGGGPIVAGPDNCTTTPNTSQANADGDSRGDVCDNCPTVVNSDQLNIDGDSFGDACDAGDFDLDFFSDRVEYFAGTDRGASCPLNQSHNAWPPDINNNGSVDIISDIASLAGVAFQSVPPAPARYDIAPDPPNGTIGIIDDISRVTGFFAQSCPP